MPAINTISTAVTSKVTSTTGNYHNNNHTNNNHTSNNHNNNTDNNNNANHRPNEAIHIIPIPALTDNYIWAIVNRANNEAILVDVGEYLPAQQFLQDNNLSLSAIWVTHHHSDHIGGIGKLLSHHPSAKLYAHKDHNVTQYQPIFVDETSQLTAFGDKVDVLATGGHTDSHLSYLLTIDDVIHVFCGDTLFKAGCGRVFTGTVEQLYHSFCQYNRLADNTIFYPAHEYTIANLTFALSIEPNNTAIKTALTKAKNSRNHNQPTLPTTLMDERAINPFLRAISDFDTLNDAYQATQLNNTQTTDTAVNQSLSSHQLLSSQKLFAQLRHLKDNF